MDAAHDGEHSLEVHLPFLQTVLDDLTRSKNDTRSTILVTFASMLTDTGSSLIKAAPWLKFVTGPANDYVKATNLALVKSYLDEAEQRVVPCDQSYRVKGSVPSNPGGISLAGAACCSTRVPATPTGWMVTSS